MQLQEVFSSYKKERLESDKALTEQNDKLLQQLSDLRSQNAKMETQLEFTSKRSVLSSKQDHLLYYTFELLWNLLNRILSKKSLCVPEGRTKPFCDSGSFQYTKKKCQIISNIESKTE